MNSNIVKLPSLISKIYSKRISYLLFNVTARCDAFCDHCWNWQRVSEAGKFNKGEQSKRHELTLDEIKAFSSTLPDLLLVNLCGGEPYIREDLTEIARIFSTQNSTNYFTIPSNGFNTELILSKAKILLKENPSSFFRFGISLDGLPKTHNALRRFKDGFQHAMNTAMALNALKKHHKNFSIGADLLFSKTTQRELPELIKLLESKNIFDQIDLNMVRGELIDNSIKEVDVELYKELSSGLVERRQANNSHPVTPVQTGLYNLTTSTIAKAKLSSKREFSCYAGQKFVTLDDCGDVHACEILEGEDYKLGNIRDYSYNLDELLKNPKAQNIIQDIIEKKCHCTWDCAINMSWIYDPKNLPLVSWSSLKSLL
ncbi:MAG: 4Fe-4S cluster-binding domain-containing protein [Bacteriovoracaceae bacterium]|nr:4Fe-4S cluster-binding domain-containing protein [Bacteriovoracaceae bacterium]